MNLTYFPAEAFPETRAAITDRLGDVVLPEAGAVVLFGGSARNALLEATGSEPQAVRDIDLAPVGDGLSDEDFQALHRELNPGDDDQAPRVFRFPDVPALLRDNIDFTLNQVAIKLGASLELVTTDDAIEAVLKRIIQPTAGRIAITQQLQAGGDATRKQFLRNETDMPARAASFVARFGAAGVHFNYDLLDHPTPLQPFDHKDPLSDEPDAAHPFYLGLMTNKTLIVDQAERGPDDITATTELLSLYQEMGLVAADDDLDTIEDIVAFCEAVSEAKPATPFYGSKVAERVRRSSRAPEPKSNR